MTQGVQNYNTLFTRYVRIRKMPQPYSDDLRWRLVWLKLFYGMSNVDISTTLFVSPKTVSRIYRLFMTTGNVTSPKVFGRPKGTTTLYEHEELIICEILLRQPTIHLKEIAYEIENTTGTRFPVESLCRTVHRLGFTMKKVSFNCSIIIILFSLSKI